MGKLLNKHTLLHQINTWINGVFFLCQKQTMAVLTQSAEAVSQHISPPKPETKSWNFKLFLFTLSPEFKLYLCFRLLGKSCL